MKYYNKFKGTRHHNQHITKMWEMGPVSPKVTTEPFPLFYDTQRVTQRLALLTFGYSKEKKSKEVDGKASS